MIIDGFEKLTLLDYPGNIACIIFTRGCNLNCPFCHNSALIPCSNSPGEIEESEIFEYLEKRKNIIEGVCITGGEPLLQHDIKEFIKKIKAMNFKVKLDSNGSNYIKLKELMEENLVDYIAMDIKNIFEEYNDTSGVKNLDIENIKKSINLIKKSKIEHEFRTTIVKEYHNNEKIDKLLKIVGKDSKYYLQNFMNNDNVVNKNLTSFTTVELEELTNTLLKNYSNAEIRKI